ncbi:MAG: hypothetical protein WDA11_06585 [Thiohalomonadaceae bacterium]
MVLSQPAPRWLAALLVLVGVLLLPALVTDAGEIPPALGTDMKCPPFCL